MMEWAKESLGKVEQSRSARFKQPAPFPNDNESESILKNFHPDYSGKERTLVIGPNAGDEKFPLELADLLEADSPLPVSYSTKPDIETDVLILGGGGKCTPNTSSGTKIQGQTPKYKSRHPNTSPNIPNTYFNHYMYIYIYIYTHL